jgi:hypothetical protein
MAQSGNSNGDQSDAKPKLLRPSPEVKAKMQPITQASFASLVKRAISSPALKLSPKSK